MVEIARAIASEGGRALVVGGYVRDRWLGIESRDIDVEIYGLSRARVRDVLRGFGSVIEVGRSFGILRVKGLDVDFSLPRRDSKAAGKRGAIAVAEDPELGFAEAARRRDLTMNSLALDPLSGEILDPYGGCRDMERRTLRATDPRYFGEDPLRGLRVAQLGARFGMRPDGELVALCRELDLSEIPAERIFEELRKLLLDAPRPSLGFEILRESALLRFFPELAALEGVPQDPDWHPEGDVWTHTMLALDEAARLRTVRTGEGATADDEAVDLALMLGVLCHDLGKPATTIVEDGRIRSPQHEPRGAEIADAFLGRLRAPKDLVARVHALVRHHLAPALFVRDGAGPKGYRRLARELERAGVGFELLVRVARADHLGRTTDEARARLFPAGDAFLARARELLVVHEAPRDVVLGRHLLARGFAPGPEMGALLHRCRDIQDETGWTDPERILDRVLAEHVRAR